MGDVIQTAKGKKADDHAQSALLLKESNEQLASLIEMISEGIAIIDKTGKIIFVNSVLEKMMGINRRQIIGSNYIDPRWIIKSGDDRLKYDHDFTFKRILKTGKAATAHEHILEVAGGKRMHISANAAPYRDENGNIVGVIIALTDATERNQAKAQIKEIKDIYQRLARYADEAIFRIQVEDSKMIYINEAAENILGYTLADYLADPSLFASLILPDYHPGWIKAVEEMKKGRDAIKNIVLGIVAKDGRTVMMEFTAVAAPNENGVINHMEVLGRDVTHHRFLEQELAKSQKLEAIGLLAGGIAHDFNNILTAVIGSLSLAKMETKPAGRLYERLSQAEDHCMKAKSLTRRLLTYSRSGSSVRKTASLAQVLQEAASFALSGKNIKCKFDLANNLWPVLIDEGQMHQVVHYLVTNAAEAMPDGGTIEIGAQNLTADNGHIPHLRAGNYVKWYVKDHGVGIPKEHMKKLFDPYFSTKQMGSIKGIGLGLAICYSIVKSHEGLINVESQPGVGTEFTVYIPALDEENGENKTPAEKTQPTAAKHKILLIDDEKILLDVTSSMLAHLGYEVKTAACHEDALDIYMEAKETGQPFSLIIMDLTIRGNEGAETAIRKWLAIHPEVRVVISSGYANDPVIEDFSNYGFVGAIVKPYTLMELKTTLEKILARNDSI
jgi:PAS domain S-box-containing protein